MDRNIVTFAYLKSLSASEFCKVKEQVCIKARVIDKTEIRNSQYGKQCFNLYLEDESGEFEAYTHQVKAEELYKMIEKDKVYYISDFEIESDKVKFLMFFKECHLVNISTIGNMEANEIVDVVGVCRDASDLSNVGATGREIIKREITLVDQSNVCISLTLWGEDAKSFDGSSKPVVLVESARIGEYVGGKTLEMIPGSVLKLNPAIPEGRSLRGWFDNEGGDHFKSL